MTGFLYELDQVISEFTLALLEDSGYYKANYYTGGLMQFGKNKGCDFLNSECVNKGKINKQFSNEFFEKIYNNNGVDSSCSTGRQSRAYHGMINYENIPEQSRYFNSKNKGGLYFADYCPVSVTLTDEIQNIYFVGHCSEIGGDNYGSAIPYKNENNKVSFYKSGELATKTGEFHSSNSFCVLSSLFSKKISDYNKYSKTLRAVCYQMHCSDRSLTIQINNNYFVCPRAGGKIDALNYEGYLLCPDYNLICSGTVLCNDMYDCVEKKSELKEVVYDYSSRTSQEYDTISKEKIEEDGYELSNNGKCPLNCHQCNEKRECLVCKEGTFLNNKKKCEKCPAGKYSSKGENKCQDCPAGQYSGEGANQCKKCASGFYSNAGSKSCIKCPNGYFSVEGGSSCIKICNNGQYPVKDKCYSCEDGTYSKAGAFKCTNCPAGTYSNKGATSCILCPSGKFSSVSSAQCFECPAGSYSNIGSSTCTKCSAGFYSNKGSSQCTKCRAGTFSLSGSYACNKCPAGTYSSIGAKTCLKCPTGEYSSEGSSSCKKCSSGQYLSKNKCNICGAGSFSKTGATKCTYCAAGTYSKKGSSSCSKCKAGYHSSKGASQCTKCKAGTYSSSGSSSCTKCKAGYYSSDGASSCNKCKAGTYSSSGSKSCKKCPRGKTSKAGSSHCK